MEINPQVPVGPGNRTECWARDWAWRSKYIETEFHRAHLRELTHSNPPPPPGFVRPLPNRRTGWRLMVQTHKINRSKKKTIWRGAQRHRRIKTCIWHKNQGFRWETKTRAETTKHITYKIIFIFARTHNNSYIYRG